MAIDIRIIQESRLIKSIINSRIVPKRVQEIVEVFEEYFGKDSVELQLRLQNDSRFTGDIELPEHDSITPKNLGAIWQATMENINPNKHLWCIIVYKPKVTITNEDNQSIDIEDLYVVIPLNMYGHIPAYPVNYLRTTYSRTQWNAGYLHSHAPHIELSYVSTPECVCIGTGPINDTIARINHCEDFNYVLWKVFVMQLDQITRVESLTGGPYIYMSDIDRNALREISLYQESYAKFYTPANFTGEEMLSCFIESFISDGRIHFRIAERGLQIAESFVDFLKKISDYYFKWQNIVLDNYHETPILFKVGMYRIKNDSIYEYGESHDAPFEPKHIITFKGEKKFLNVYDDSLKEVKEPYIDIETAQALYETITKWANCRYSNEPETLMNKYGNKKLKRRILYL